MTDEEREDVPDPAGDPDPSDGDPSDRDSADGDSADGDPSGGQAGSLIYGRPVGFWKARFFFLLAATATVSGILAWMAASQDDYRGAGACLTATAVSIGILLLAIIKD